MIPKKLAPDLIRGGNRFRKKIMLKTKSDLGPIQTDRIKGYRHSVVLPDFAGGDLQAVSIFLRTPSTPARSNLAGGVAPEPSCTRTPNWLGSDMRSRSRAASPRKVAAFPPVDVSHRSCTSCWVLRRYATRTSSPINGFHAPVVPSDISVRWERQPMVSIEGALPEVLRVTLVAVICGL